MGVGMSLDQPRQVWMMRQVLALQVLLEYGPAADSRPPVTAALIAANALVHVLRPGGLLPRLSQVAFNPHRIIQVYVVPGFMQFIWLRSACIPRYSTYYGTDGWFIS